MSSSISPDSQNFDATDQATMKVKGREHEETSTQVKDDEGPNDDTVESEDGECHPVEAGESVDHEDDDVGAEEEHIAAEGLRNHFAGCTARRTAGQGSSPRGKSGGGR